MSILQANGAGLGGAGDPGGPLANFYSYSIDQSLRFNDDDIAYLSKTYGSAGNAKTFTISCWIKRANINTASHICASYDGSSTRQFRIFFTSSDEIQFGQGGSATSGIIKTNALFRDVSSWYHCVFVADYSNATAAERAKIYVNGELQTVTTTDSFLNADGHWLKTYEMRIGRTGTSDALYFDGYIADFHCIDGTALDPTSFGETINGIWVPKAYSGSYGTNGFYLDFSTNSYTDNLTDPDVFADQAGSNDWNAYNLAASDILPDSPTNNFATWNSAGRVYGASNVPTFSEGNLKSVTGTYPTANISTFAIQPNDTTGYYWEVKVVLVDAARSYMGIIAPEEKDLSGNGTSYGWPYKYILSANGDFFGSTATNGTGTVAQTSYTTNDILMFAYKEGKIWIGKNGTWMNAGDPAAGTGNLLGSDGSTPSDRGAVTWYPYAGFNLDVTANFGEGTFAGTETAGGNADENGYGDFKYAVPSGFLALCSANLPEVTIGPNSTTTSDQHFDTVLYSGTLSSSGTADITHNGGFTPDFVWTKSRSASSQHILRDAIRGANNTLQSESTLAEQDKSSNGNMTALATSTTFATNYTDGLNVSGKTFVAWLWKAGGTAVSNTDGSITSSVSANQDAGFSIVSYTGTGANATVGHGLSSAPEMVIVKERGGAGNWFTYHKDAQASGAYVIYLNLTNASAASTAIWNNTQPTDTVFSLGTGNTNTNTDTYIAYCFHSSDVCKVGSYVGNGSTDGTFVYTGFRPAWVMVKRTDSTSNWQIWDATRNEYNVTNLYLLANTDGAEVVGSGGSIGIDITSNGWKFRSNAANWNASGGSYIYLAFAEAPFKYANAR